MMRYVYAHQPALTAPEAALLPALPQSGRGTYLRPNLLVPDTDASFIPAALPVAALAPETQAQTVAYEVNDRVYRRAETAPRTGGSVAGRAVLSAAGISLPGVSAMRQSCRRVRDRQAEPAPCEEELEYL